MEPHSLGPRRRAVADAVGLGFMLLVLLDYLRPSLLLLPTVTAGGASQTFTVDVKNTGVSEADHLSLSDTVPGSLIVDSVAASGVTCPDGDSNPQTITCSALHLAAGATASITVTYHVASTTDSAAA